MGEVVNLRRARKARAREDAARMAAENRVRHGRSKEQCEIEALGAERDSHRLEGHRLETD